MKNADKPLLAVSGWIAGCLYSFAISWSLILSHGLKYSVWDCALLTMLVVAIPVVLFYNKYISLVVMALSLGALAFSLLRLEELSEYVTEHYADRFTDIWFFVTAQRVGIADENIPLLCVIFIIIGAIFALLTAVRLHNAVIMAVSSAALYIAEWHLGTKNLFLCMSLTAVSCVMVAAGRGALDFAYRYKTRQRASAAVLLTLPLMLLITLCLSVFLPENTRDMRTEWSVSMMDGGLLDGFGLSGSGISTGNFDIGDFGFGSKKQLGGPISPGSEAVLYLMADGGIDRLRGAIYDTYDGSSWTNTGIYDSYKLGEAPGRLTDAFNLNMPEDEESRRELFTPVSVQVSFGYGTRTILTPSRLESCVSADNSKLYPYFTAQGGVYAKGGVDKFQPYIVKGYNFSADTSLLQSRATAADVPEELSAYLQTPWDDDTKKQILKDFLFQIVYKSMYDYRATIAEMLGTYDEYVFLQFIYGEMDQLVDEQLLTLPAVTIANLIMNELGSYRYTLAPSELPEGRDFVDYFLETQEGYCTYFASAMTMLARAAGIPARYVEGFYLEGVKLVSYGYTAIPASAAHAWSELYIDGIGWVPFDATPALTVESPVLPEDYDTEATIEPLVPTPEPTQNPVVTPVPPQEELPTAEPTQAPAEKEPEGGFDWTGLLRYMPYVLTPIAAIGLGYFLYRLIKRLTKRRSPTAMLKRKRMNTELLALIYWNDLLAMLVLSGQKIEPGQTPAEIVKNAGKGRQWVALSAEIVESTVYGGTSPATTELESMYEAVCAMRRLCAYQKGKLKVFIHMGFNYYA